MFMQYAHLHNYHFSLKYKISTYANKLNCETLHGLVTALESDNLKSCIQQAYHMEEVDGYLKIYNDHNKRTLILKS